MNKTSWIHCRFDADLKKWIDEQAIKLNLSNSDYLRQIITNLKENKLVSSANSKELREDKKLELQIDKTKWYIEKSKSEIVKNIAETKFKRVLVNEYERKTEKLPQKILELKVKLDKNDYDKNPVRYDGLMCVDCGRIFTCKMNDRMAVANTSDFYVKHVEQTHKRKLFIEENSELIELNQKFTYL